MDLYCKIRKNNQILRKKARDNQGAVAMLTWVK